MRRSLFLAGGAVALGALTAALTTEDPVHAGWVPNVAVVTDDGRVAVVRHGEISPPVPGKLSGDDAVLVTASQTSTPGATDLTWQTLSTGAVTASRSVPGLWTVAAVDMPGTYVALTHEVNGSTEIAVVTPTEERLRTTVPGWVELEAFQVGDGGVPFGLYALAYAEPPAAGAAPKYRVRQLSFETKQLELVQNLRDKKQLVDQNMQAVGFNSVLTSNPAMRFSLYRGTEGEHTADVAFIHITGLRGPFGAWCFDLDERTGLLRHPGTLSVGVDDSRVLVISGTGMITEIDTTTLAVQEPEIKPAARRMVQAWQPTDPTLPPMAAVAGGQIAVLQGETVYWLDPVTLQPTRTSSLHVGGPIDAFTATDDGHLVAFTGQHLVSSDGAVGYTPAITGVLDGGTAVRVVLFEPQS